MRIRPTGGTVRPMRVSLPRIDRIRLDRALAIGLFTMAQFELWSVGSIPGAWWLGLAATATGTLPVAVRRARPLLAVALVTGTIVTLNLAAGPPSSVAFMAAWICTLYGLAVWGDRNDFVIGSAALLVGVAGASIQEDAGIAGILAFAGIPLFAMVVARRVVRERDARADALTARAEVLERDQELRIREAAELERATVARELHDVVAHKVSVMVVQAGAERSILDPAATSTEETLRTIEATGREALVELRRLLGVLRSGESQPLAPQPTLADVDALVAQVRDTGLDVELRIEGEPRRLAPGVELSAFRIVQESLTNVLKHAGGAHAFVALRFEATELEIEVRDEGGSTGAPGPGTGHGLLGIRERVALLGGRVHAGPTADGYAVRAWLPAGT
jgi:signal transduction histidine kinase